MTNVITLNNEDLAVTPYFKYMELENIPKSESAGRMIKETMEMVEVRIAGDRNFRPCFPAHAMSHREGSNIITYAERWKEQYQAFKAGSNQEAQGTPLSELTMYGITPEQLSLCRALSIHSIEALQKLEGANAKSLGVHQNALKDAARKYAASQTSALNAMSEIDALKAEIVRLNSFIIAPPATVDEIEQAVEAAAVSLSDKDMKDEIERITGSRPKGNPSTSTLQALLAELSQGQQAAA